MLKTHPHPIPLRFGSSGRRWLAAVTNVGTKSLLRRLVFRGELPLLVSGMLTRVLPFMRMRVSEREEKA